MKYYNEVPYILNLNFIIQTTAFFEYEKNILLPECTHVNSANFNLPKKYLMPIKSLNLKHL